MKVTVLTDNNGCGDLHGEWGLSLLVEHDGKRILLDTGASGLFLENASKIGVSISDVDIAVISHAHYDHAGGLRAFLSANGTAPVYLSPGAGESCYAGLGFIGRYIGMPRGILEEFPSRFVRPEGVAEIADGVMIVPHSTPGLQRLGRRNHLYVRQGLHYRPDGFAHEHTLVFRTKSGLVLMNSCSHSGPDVVVDEVLKEFPGERIAAYIGGLHLFRLSDREVEAIADRILSRGIGRIYTGHCTGQRAFELLKARLGDGIGMFRCGMEMDIL